MGGGGFWSTKNLSCVDGGISAIYRACTVLYTGKAFSLNWAVFDHSKHCQVGKKRENFSTRFPESVHTLVEIQDLPNIQKT